MDKMYVAEQLQIFWENPRTKITKKSFKGLLKQFNLQLLNNKVTFSITNCILCNKQYEITNYFNKLEGHCRHCAIKVRQQAQAKKHRKKRLKYEREYRELNREKVNEYAKNYHREKVENERK